MLRSRILAMALASTALAGCDANQLYMAYQTNIGIHAAVNPQMTEGSLMIGYRRDFAAVVPRSVPVRADGTAAAGTAPEAWDAMAAMVCSDLVVSGIWLDRYEENLATGPAAIAFAKELAKAKAGEQARDFFSCFRSSSQPAATGGTGQ